MGFDASQAGAGAGAVGGAVGRTAQDASLPTGYGPLTKQISKNDISL